MHPGTSYYNCTAASYIIIAFSCTSASAFNLSKLKKIKKENVQK